MLVRDQHVDRAVLARNAVDESGSGHSLRADSSGDSYCREEELFRDRFDERSFRLGVVAVRADSGRPCEARLPQYAEDPRTRRLASRTRRRVDLSTAAWPRRRTSRLPGEPAVVVPVWTMSEAPLTGGASSRRYRPVYDRAHLQRRLRGRWRRLGL